MRVAVERSGFSPEGARTLYNSLSITVRAADGSPIEDATIDVSVVMIDMDMGKTPVEIKNNHNGSYIASWPFVMTGSWRATILVKASGQEPVTKIFDYKERLGMRGKLGPWSMSREASGTSWIPESSPMFMMMLPPGAGFDLSLMGSFSLDENSSGGPRGDHRFFSNSMIMFMGSKEAQGGTLGFSLMASLDPVFNGRYGYPDLFQTGETAYGNKLTDYQHPHDLIDEAVVTYSHPIGGGLNGFVYAGPVGEPALGGPTFMHRPSGMEIPEAPISHHWFDSTHISWGVVTLGVNNDKWQLETSAFNGHEPDENRYSPDPIALNSASARLTFNPAKNLSLNTSYGYLNSPESTDPGVDQHRLTVAAIWNQPLAHGNNLAFTAGFGRLISLGKNSDAFFAESTLLTGSTSIFARWEHVDKDELVGVPTGNYMINKFLIGGVKDFAKSDGFDIGVGAYAGLYIFPSSLDPFYGRSPVTLGAFLRIRPGRM